MGARCTRIGELRTQRSLLGENPSRFRNVVKNDYRLHAPLRVTVCRAIRKLAPGLATHDGLFEC